MESVAMAVFFILIMFFVYSKPIALAGLTFAAWWLWNQSRRARTPARRAWAKGALAACVAAGALVGWIVYEKGWLMSVGH